MIIKFLKSLILVVASFIFLSLGNLSLAISCEVCSDQAGLSSQQAAECGTSCASGNNQTPQDAQDKVNGTVKTVINLLSVVAGIAAVIMIILAGFRYITSNGKQESIASAKNSLIYALIGLVIVALAQVLVRFVLTRVSKS